MPKFLPRIFKGNDLLNIVLDAYFFDMDHDELKTQREVEFVGSFLQTLDDWGNLGSPIEPSDRVQAAFDLTKEIEEIDKEGFWIFGYRATRIMEIGNTGEMNCPVCIIRVLRKDNPDILKIDLKNESLCNIQDDIPF